MDHIEKLKNLLSKSRVGMLGTMEGTTMRFTPMTHVDVDEAGNIWFFTSLDSEKVKDIKEYTEDVILNYSNESDNLFVSMSGVAYINQDRERMEELFNPFVKAWFPDGLDSADLALLVVQPLDVEYWASGDGKLMSSVKMLVAAVTGNRPTRQEHGNISL